MHAPHRTDTRHIEQQQQQHQHIHKPHIVKNKLSLVWASVNELNRERTWWWTLVFNCVTNGRGIERGMFGGVTEDTRLTHRGMLYTLGPLITEDKVCCQMATHVSLSRSYHSTHKLTHGFIHSFIGLRVECGANAALISLVAQLSYGGFVGRRAQVWGERDCHVKFADHHHHRKFKTPSHSRRRRKRVKKKLLILLESKLGEESWEPKQVFSPLSLAFIGAHTHSHYYYVILLLLFSSPSSRNSSLQISHHFSFGTHTCLFCINQYTSFSFFLLSRTRSLAIKTDSFFLLFLFFSLPLFDWNQGGFILEETLIIMNLLEEERAWSWWQCHKLKVKHFTFLILMNRWKRKRYGESFVCVPLIHGFKWDEPIDDDDNSIKEQKVFLSLGHHDDD